jgi:hypothetical protein
MAMYLCSECDEWLDGDWFPMDNEGRCEECAQQDDDEENDDE